MPRGFWDHGVNPNASLMAPDVSLAELAARLGSPDVYERLGEVIALDSFEHGLARWRVDTYGNGAAVNLTTSPVRSGGYACQLIAGSSGNAYAEIAMAVPYIGAPRLGFELAIAFPTVLDDLRICIYTFTGTRQVQTVIRYVEIGSLLYYLDDGGLWTQFADITTLGGITGQFHLFKLVIDAQAEKYGRLRLNGNSYDLSAIPAYASNDVSSPYVDVSLKFTGYVGQNNKAVVDDAIVTCNEP